MGNPEIYSHDYYQRLFTLEGRHWWHLGMREIAVRLLHSQTGSQPFTRTLDAGCGTGASLAWTHDLLGARTVIGIDIAREALSFCRSTSNRPVLQASILQLPFHSESFDLLLCQDVLQHLPTDGSDVRALQEMSRVLRPGGLLLVRANSRLGMWQADTDRDVDFQRYTLPEIVSRLQAAGFIVKRETYANALLGLYASLQRRVRLRHLRQHQHGRLYEGLSTRDGAASASKLNQVLLWVLKAEARYLSRPTRHLGFGHSTFCLGMKPSDDAADESGDVDVQIP
jgi:SAM-dependent methyltransferase